VDRGPPGGRAGPVLLLNRPDVADHHGGRLPSPDRSCATAAHRGASGERTTIRTTPRHPARTDIAELAAEAGLRRIHVLAWRDLADVEAGGSEIYAARIGKIWAEAGLDVFMRTSHAQGHPPEGRREGYRVLRRGGRYLLFPSAIINEALSRHGPRDAIFEFWNGVPFLTPVWFRGPRAVVIHHVHRDMWDVVVAERLAKFGRALEAQIAPPFYRYTPIVTPSESSREDIIRLLGIPARNISIASPGIDDRFQPGGEKSPTPLLVSVGRLMPPKRFDEIIRIAHEVHEHHPDLQLVIVGDGYERPKLEELVRDLDAESWVRLAGHVSDEELVSLYQRAWAVTSASSAEGWGMTLTEAGACGTPAVASRITGHTDSVDEGYSGLLGDDSRDMVEKIRMLITDDDLRLRLSEGARKHSAEYTWDVTAHTCFTALARDAIKRRRRGAMPTP
jgi:glycosyltransferase involved in cell wall biosynthesis